MANRRKLNTQARFRVVRHEKYLFLPNQCLLNPSRLTGPAGGSVKLCREFDQSMRFGSLVNWPTPCAKVRMPSPQRLSLERDCYHRCNAGWGLSRREVQAPANSL